MKILENKVLVLNVRDYYLFRELFKWPFIYFGYCAGSIVIAADSHLLSLLGY